MKITWKWWILISALLLSSCAQLPLAGIVTITPQPTVIEAGPTAQVAATSLPITITSPAALSMTASPPTHPATQTPQVSTQPATSQTPTIATTPLSPALQAMVAKARQDLAERLSIPESDIWLIQVSAVDWADMSLGCPLPGMMYGQMVTAGYLVILSAGDRQYSYHAGPTQVPFYCSKPQNPIQVNPGV